jgi:hypothetical protein
MGFTDPQNFLHITRNRAPEREDLNSVRSGFNLASDRLTQMVLWRSPI